MTELKDHVLDRTGFEWRVDTEQFGPPPSDPDPSPATTNESVATENTDSIAVATDGGETTRPSEDVDDAFDELEAGHPGADPRGETS